MAVAQVWKSTKFAIERHHGKAPGTVIFRLTGPFTARDMYGALSPDALRGTFEAGEGKARARNIVLEFKDHATALACYRSPEYAKAKALRAGAVDIDIIVIEGYDGPQPTD